MGGNRDREGGGGVHRRRPEGFLFQPNYIPFDAGVERGEEGLDAQQNLVNS